MRMRTTAALLLCGLLALGACGGDDDDDDAATSTEDTTADTTAPEASADETEPPATGEDGDEQAEVTDTELVDPCGLLTADEISSISGSDPGAGDEQSVDPEQRRVCTYDNGLILAVEVGENYETSVQLMRDNAEGS